MNLESQKITNHDLLNHLSKVLFPRMSSLRWLMAEYNAIVTWFLNFRVYVFWKAQ